MSDRQIEPPAVTLRPVEDRDLHFLRRLYDSTRTGETVLLHAAAQKEDFLRMQFHAQHKHYRDNYPDARYEVIVRDGEDIGRLYVARMEHEIRLMDITLLPEHRNRGIGRMLVQQLLDEADQARKFVSLHVEEASPAKRLYERLGFQVVGGIAFYKLMHWIPAGLTPIVEG